MNKKIAFKIIGRFVLLLLFIFLFQAWFLSFTFALTGTVKIGVIEPATGRGSEEFGTRSLRGKELAVEKINASGGIDGAKLEIEVFDTRTDKAKAIAGLKKFGAQKEFIAISGPLASMELVACAPVAEEIGIVVLSPGSAAVWKGNFNDWTFRNQLVTMKSTKPFITALQKKLGIKSMAIFYEVDNDNTLSVMKLLKEQLCPELGITLTQIEPTRFGDSDFSVQATKLQQNEPGMIFMAVPMETSGTAIKQIRERGIKSQMMGGPEFNDPKIYQVSGGYAQGVFTVVPFNPSDERPMVKDFVRMYKEKFKEEFPTYVALGYDNIMLLADAIRRANTTTNRKAVRDALGSTKNFEGLCGFYTYQNSGDNVNPTIHILRMNKGVYEPFMTVK
jgi:branched-chain amino acid transport system substrate-binding protein